MTNSLRDGRTINSRLTAIFMNRRDLIKTFFSSFNFSKKMEFFFQRCSFKKRNSFPPSSPSPHHPRPLHITFSLHFSFCCEREKQEDFFHRFLYRSKKLVFLYTASTADAAPAAAAAAEHDAASAAAAAEANFLTRREKRRES